MLHIAYSGDDKITLTTSNTNASEQALSRLLTGSYCYASNTQTTDPNTSNSPTARDIESDICSASSVAASVTPFAARSGRK